MKVEVQQHYHLLLTRLVDSVLDILVVDHNRLIFSRIVP